VNLYGESFPNFSNGGGKNWSNGYWRPISITNSAAVQTDYQILVQPFQDSNFINNSGLVGSWHFSEGTGTTTADTSGNGGTGTLYNSPPWIDGKFSKGLKFTDVVGERVQISDSASLRPQNLTLEVWLKITANQDPANGFFRPILNKYYAGTGSYGAPWNSYKLELLQGMTTSNTQVHFCVNNSTSTDVRLASSVLTPYIWHHIVGTYDQSAGTMKLYVDGQLNTQTANSTAILYDSGPLYFGVLNDTQDSLIGQIDEVKIYNRALSASEIQNRYSYYTKIKGDYADIRFTQTHYGTQIPYWQETDNKFWVKVPTLPANKDTIIYMYYGNISATSASSFTNTLVDIFTNPGFNAADGWTYAEVEGGAPNTTATPTLPSTDWFSEGAGSYYQYVRYNYTHTATLYGQESQTINLPAGSNYKIWFDAKTTILYNTGSVGTVYAQVLDDAVAIWSTTWTTNQTNILLLNQETSSLSSGSHTIRFRTGTTASGATIRTDMYYDNIRVRKYVSPEPLVAAPGTEQMSGNGNYIRLTEEPNNISRDQTVAMGNSIPYCSFKLRLVNDANTSQKYARWKRFRIDKYTAPTATECPSEKVVVQVWAETSKADSLKNDWDAGTDTIIQQGNFDYQTGVCWLNMNRYKVTTTAQKFYIVFKLANDCPGGSRLGFKVEDGSFLEFENAAVSNENF
jgi:hypothetical protein